MGNRISIVKFAGNRYYNYTSPTGTDPATDPNAPLTEGDDTYASGQYRYNYTQVLKGFTATADTITQVGQLKNAIDGITAAGATSADYGMNLAKKLITVLMQMKEVTAGRPLYSSLMVNRIINRDSTLMSPQLPFSTQRI